MPPRRRPIAQRRRPMRPRNAPSPGYPSPGLPSHPRCLARPTPRPRRRPRQNPSSSAVSRSNPKVPVTRGVPAPPSPAGASRKQHPGKPACATDRHPEARRGRGRAEDMARGTIGEPRHHAGGIVSARRPSSRFLPDLVAERTHEVPHRPGPRLGQRLTGSGLKIAGNLEQFRAEMI
jgi:hypothetical protein